KVETTLCSYEFRRECHHATWEQRWPCGPENDVYYWECGWWFFELLEEITRYKGKRRAVRFTDHKSV
ncbi:hypothetical protein S245_008025, partial [Arachis hypogaea]